MNNINKIKKNAAKRRHNRVRAKISGTSKRPRLNVSRSLSNIFLQLIDDENNKTLVSAHSKNINDKSKKKTKVAYETGKLLAGKAQKSKITECVFDRGDYIYHGRIKAAADGAREGGLKF